MILGKNTKRHAKKKNVGGPLSEGGTGTEMGAYIDEVGVSSSV